MPVEPKTFHYIGGNSKNQLCLRDQFVDKVPAKRTFYGKIRAASVSIAGIGEHGDLVTYKPKGHSVFKHLCSNKESLESPLKPATLQSQYMLEKASKKQHHNRVNSLGNMQGVLQFSNNHQLEAGTSNSSIGNFRNMFKEV